MILFYRLCTWIFLLIFFIYFLASAHQTNDFEEKNESNILKKELNTSSLFNSSDL